MSVQVQDDKTTMNKRFESIAWGLFLIMLGGLWLVPNSMLPNGMWGIGVGLIMLGLNYARYRNGIPMSNFTLVVGGLALLTGIAAFFNTDLPLFPILLILIGVGMLLKWNTGKETASKER